MLQRPIVILDNDVAHPFGIVDDVDALHIVAKNVVLGEHDVLQPVDETAPVIAAEEDHRKVGDLLRLDEREDAEDLIERAEASRERDEGLGVLYEHRLADEE